MLFFSHCLFSVPSHVMWTNLKTCLAYLKLKLKSFVLLPWLVGRMCPFHSPPALPRPPYHCTRHVMYLWNSEWTRQKQVILGITISGYLSEWCTPIPEICQGVHHNSWVDKWSLLNWAGSGLTRFQNVWLHNRAQQGVVYKLSKLVHLTLVPKNIKQKIAILSRKWMLKIKMKRSGSKAR